MRTGTRVDMPCRFRLPSWRRRWALTFLRIRPLAHSCSIFVPVAVCVILATALSLSRVEPRAVRAAIPEPTTLSVSEAVALAVKHNESLLMARADEDRAAGAVREAYAGALPNLSLQATYQRNFDKPAFYAPEELGGGKIEVGSDIEVQGALRLDQVLYAFGRVGNAVEYAKTYRKIAELSVEATRGTVISTARKAYYRVLLAQQLARIRGQSLTQARSHFSDLKEKFTQGVASRFALQRAEVEVHNREPELIRAENDLALARQDLARLLGLEGDTAFVLTDSLSYEDRTLDLEAAIREGLTQRAEILALEQQVAGQERIVSIYQAENLPILGLYGQVGFQGASDTQHPFDPLSGKNRAISTSVGLSVRMPIFDGFRTKGKVEQARAGLEHSRYELQQARKSIRLEITKAVQDLQSLQREYEAQLATVALAEETYAIAEVRFRTGLSTQLELNDAGTALDLARTRFAEMLYRYNVAVANLERALGIEVEVDGHVETLGPDSEAGSDLTGRYPSEQEEE